MHVNRVNDKSVLNSAPQVGLSRSLHYVYCGDA